MKSSKLHLPPWADRLGAVGAFICALHCALVPVALAVVPALGMGLVAWHGFEVGFSVFATVLAVVSLVLGYRNHRAYHAWLLVTPGLVLIWGSLLVPALHASTTWHGVAMAVGGVLISAAHLVNLRLSYGHTH
ncbi:MerC domain-containing protein [Arenimonas sp. MALMAid1274]|uniref:MerC domain-containing protein n=1 Tax=Arenimonas sp. MALMAid1274 TaxID=3411630 RepID=UPI003BA0C4DD